MQRLQLPQRRRHQRQQSSPRSNRNIHRPPATTAATATTNAAADGGDDDDDDSKMKLLHHSLTKYVLLTENVELIFRNWLCWRKSGTLHNGRVSDLCFIDTAITVYLTVSGLFIFIKLFLWLLQTLT